MEQSSRTGLYWVLPGLAKYGLRLLHFLALEWVAIELNLVGSNRFWFYRVWSVVSKAPEWIFVSLNPFGLKKKKVFIPFLFSLDRELTVSLGSTRC